MFCFGMDMTVFLGTDNILFDNKDFRLISGTNSVVLYEKLNGVCLRVASMPQQELPGGGRIEGSVLSTDIGALCRGSLLAVAAGVISSDKRGVMTTNLSPTCFVNENDGKVNTLLDISKSVYSEKAFNCPMRIYSKLEEEKPSYIPKDYNPEYLRYFTKSINGTITGVVGDKVAVAMFPKNSILISDWIRGSRNIIGKEEVITRLLDIFLNIPYTYMFKSASLVRRRNVLGTMFSSGCSNYYETNDVGVLEYLSIPIEIYMSTPTATMAFSQIKLALKVLEDEALTNKVLEWFPDELIVRGLDIMDSEQLGVCTDKFTDLMLHLGKDFADSHNLANFDNLVYWPCMAERIESMKSSKDPDEKMYNTIKHLNAPLSIYGSKEYTLFRRKKVDIEKAASRIKVISEKRRFAKALGV